MHFVNEPILYLRGRLIFKLLCHIRTVTIRKKLFIPSYYSQAVWGSHSTSSITVSITTPPQRWNKKAEKRKVLCAFGAVTQLVTSRETRVFQGSSAVEMSQVECVLNNDTDCSHYGRWLSAAIVALSYLLLLMQ